MEGRIISSRSGYVSLDPDSKLFFLLGVGKVKGLVSLAQTSCVTGAHCPGGATNQIVETSPCHNDHAVIDSDWLYRQDSAHGWHNSSVLEIPDPSL